MKTKTVLISAAAAAALLAGSATSASAQPYGEPSWGPRSFARMSYTEYFRQLRACQRHARLHGELGREHVGEHYEGVPSRGDHDDLHGALDQAHDAYHYEQPRANFCNRIIYTSRFRNPYGYWNRNYANRYGSGYGFGDYGNGYGSGAYGYGYGNGSGYDNGYAPDAHGH